MTQMTATMKRLQDIERVYSEIQEYLQELDTEREKLRKVLDKPQYTCQKCGHTWEPRLTRPPKVCPKCKTTRWCTL